MIRKKKIAWLTGTRADFGKIKKLIRTVDDSEDFESYLFATGMHLLPQYGTTIHEILKEEFSNTYVFNNVSSSPGMDLCLANTINGFSCYIRDIEPDLIVVHGDRPEPLAGAIVGSFNNIFVAHIEGGELSGTIDGLIRHSISKLSHAHFVSNDTAKKRLLSMGETPESVFVIGSPNIDLMLSDTLPTLNLVKQHYGIEFGNYAVFSYHPVTTEVSYLEHRINQVIDALIQSKHNYILIQPNNDLGSKIITQAYERLRDNPRFAIFKSLRFEYFLSILKHCDFMIGNSSSGICEAPVYGVPTINIGTRQTGRHQEATIHNVAEDTGEILQKMKQLEELPRRTPAQNYFGNGNSAELFMHCIRSEDFWNISIQKEFNETTKTVS